jgi:hypothetical protein
MTQIIKGNKKDIIDELRMRVANLESEVLRLKQLVYAWENACHDIRAQRRPGDADPNTYDIAVNMHKMLIG